MDAGTELWSFSGVDLHILREYFISLKCHSIEKWVSFTENLQVKKKKNIKFCCCCLLTPNMILAVKMWASAENLLETKVLQAWSTVSESESAFSKIPKSFYEMPC